jgi:transcriptional regulator with XRE-family HTH domain
LKQRDAARILGLSDSSLVSRWEQGARLPSTVNLFKLAAVYRTLVDALYIDLLRDVRAEVRRRERRILKREQHDSQTRSSQDAA